MTHVGRTLLSSCMVWALQGAGWCNFECEWANNLSDRYRFSFKGVEIANVKTQWGALIKERSSWQFSKTSAGSIEMWEGVSQSNLVAGLFLPARLHNIMTGDVRWGHFIGTFWSELLSVHLGKVPFGLSTYGGRGQRSAAGVQGPAVDPINKEGCLQTQLPDHSVHRVELLYSFLSLHKTEGATMSNTSYFKKTGSTLDKWCSLSDIESLNVH